MLPLLPPPPAAFSFLAPPAVVLGLARLSATPLPLLCALANVKDTSRS